ncbi:MAG TPA: MBL fold metallo-hydrolase [Anaerolineales bacterium]|nr:MBL fold metallo-hydrolase [Anaerolineales bacterium]
MKITDNVFVVPNVVANTYILVDTDGLTLIDAGLPGSTKKILGYIAGLGKSPQDVKRIVITHSDLDHIGSLAALQKATGARTYASQIEAEAIAKGTPSREIKRSGFSLRGILFPLLAPFFKATPFQVHEIVAEGQVLGGLQVLETPGHTPGHISLFAPSIGVLFCGDSMVAEAKGLLGSRPGITWDEARARSSERKQAALGARIVCSGHGPVVMDAAGKFPV